MIIHRPINGINALLVTYATITAMTIRMPKDTAAAHTKPKPEIPLFEMISDTGSHDRMNRNGVYFRNNATNDAGSVPVVSKSAVKSWSIQLRMSHDEYPNHSCTTKLMRFSNKVKSQSLKSKSGSLRPFHNSNHMLAL